MKKNKKENNLYELHDDFNPNELDEVEKELSQYLVKYPDEYNIDATINTLRQYVPDKKKQKINVKERFLVLIKHSKVEISIISHFYWIISSILFVLGFFITNYGGYNPLFTLVILAPLPFIFGLLEVFKGREQGVMEMEMACKFSAQEILLSRLFLIGVYNVTLNTLLMISFIPFVGSVSLWQMLFIWFTPFTIFAALSLWLSMKLRGAVFVTTFMALWLIFTFLLVSSQPWFAVFIQFNIISHLLLMLFGLSLLAYQVRTFMKKYLTYVEGLTVDVNY